MNYRIAPSGAFAFVGGAMTTFTAQIAAFAEKAQRNAELVLKQSAQDVFELAQTTKASEAKKPRKNTTRGGGNGGNLPVDTGFLLNSFVSELNGGGMAKGQDAYVMTIAGMELGDTVFGGWTAEYARAVEYGTSKMAGSFFALRAAQQWQSLVAKNAEKVRNL